MSPRLAKLREKRAMSSTAPKDQPHSSVEPPAAEEAEEILEEVLYRFEGLFEGTRPGIAPERKTR